MSMTAEYIVVCIDNSAEAYLRGTFEPQIEAAKYYCQTKLEANRETEVTLFTMGSYNFSLVLDATSDIKEILDCLSWITSDAGCLSFKNTLSHGMAVSFWGCPPNKQKRMLFLVGSLVDLNDKEAKEHGSRLKKLGIAVDVVTFILGERAKNTCMPNQYGKMEVDAFVGFVKDNSNVTHLSSMYDIHHALSKSISRFLTFSSPPPKKYKLTGGKETGHHGHHISHHPVGTSRKTNHRKKAKGKNHAAGDNKHARSEALSLENERVKLGKRKRT